MGCGAIFLTTNKKSIDQAATETVSLWLLTPPCLSASLSICLYLPETASASSFGISSLARSMKVAANCFTLNNSTAQRGGGGGVEEVEGVEEEE